MTQKHLILLLQIMKGNGNITSLINQGLTYSQIANYTDFVIEKEYISIIDNKFKITEKGEKRLKSLNTKLNRKNSNMWISPRYECKVEKMKLSDIYIPKKI
jgi:predicted transcriptional regulator